MSELIKVGMADYKVGRNPDSLISYGLGSCVGIALYDPLSKIGISPYYASRQYTGSVCGESCKIC